MTPADHDPLPLAFRRLLLTWATSVTGDGMRFAAIPLLALSIRPTPGAVSAVAAAMALPWLLIAFPAGSLVDRLDPAKVIAAANAARALVSSVLVVTVVAGAADIPLLCITAFALTAAETFADGAAQSLLVRTVPTDRLEKANARFLSSENVGLDLIGPLAAGGLFALAHWLPFAVSAVLFAGTAVGVLGLTGHRGHVVRRATGRRPATHHAVSAIRTILADPGLRTLVFTVGVMASAIAAAEGVLVVYATTSLHLPPAVYPTLLGSYSVGLLATAAAVSRWGNRVRSGPVMVAAIVLIGSTLLVLGVFPHRGVAWVCFLLMGVGGGAWNILSATRRQRRTPPTMVARVSSTFRAISWGALPLGTAAGGVIGEAWSVPGVFVLAGIVVLVLAAATGTLLLRSESTQPEPMPDGLPEAGAEPTVGPRLP